MPLIHYAFIVKGVGYEPRTHRSVFDAPQFKTTFVGVSTTDEAKTVAAELVISGIQLIELCGGFTADDCANVQTHIGESVLVGVVRCSPKQEARLAEACAV
jgi:Family of unknown function (DUF6506)